MMRLFFLVLATISSGIVNQSAIAEDKLGQLDYILETPINCSDPSRRVNDSTLDIPLQIRFFVGSHFQASAVSGVIAGSLVPAGNGVIRLKSDMANIVVGTVKGNGEDKLAFHIEAFDTNWCSTGTHMQFTFDVRGRDRSLELTVFFKSTSDTSGLTPAAMRTVRTIIDTLYGQRLRFYLSGDGHWYDGKAVRRTPISEDHQSPSDYCEILNKLFIYT